MRCIRMLVCVCVCVVVCVVVCVCVCMCVYVITIDRAYERVRSGICVQDAVHFQRRESRADIEPEREIKERETERERERV